MNFENFLGKLTDDETVDLFVEVLNLMPFEKVGPTMRENLTKSKRQEVIAWFETDEV